MYKIFLQLNVVLLGSCKWHTSKARSLKPASKEVQGGFQTSCPGTTKLKNLNQILPWLN